MRRDMAGGAGSGVASRGGWGKLRLACYVPERFGMSTSGGAGKVSLGRLRYGLLSCGWKGQSRIVAARTVMAGTVGRVAVS